MEPDFIPSLGWASIFASTETTAGTESSAVSISVDPSEIPTGLGFSQKLKRHDCADGSSPAAHCCNQASISFGR
jgi:hypothetical protein